jgi:outer membrane protein
MGAQRPVITAVAVVLVTLTTLWSRPSLCQTLPTATETVALEQVLRLSLANSTDLKLAATDVEAARAATMVAGAPFDSALALVASGRRGYQLGEPSAPPQPTRLQQIALQAGWTRQLHGGVLIAPEIGTTQTRLELDPRVDYTQATARLRLSLHLLRDRWGAVTDAPERAAAAEGVSSILDRRQAVARVMLEAAGAYWDYLSARRRLDVLTASEARAKTTLSDTTALARADERTAADVVQAEGHYAARKAVRIQAEQDLIAAWADLAVLTGWPAGDQHEVPPEAITNFPSADAVVLDGQLPRLVGQAWAQRVDLLAAQERVGAAEVRVTADRNALLPVVDLDLIGGYTAESRGPGVRHLVEPLYRDIPGVDLMAQVHVELPIARSGPRGRLGESWAALQRQRLVRADLERRIRVRVPAAYETVKRGGLRLHESERAAKLLQQTVDNEKRRFQLGMATLFSVIQAQEQLTSALLDEILGQRAYATALSQLRYETGGLAPAGGPDLNVAALAERLTSVP